MGNPIAVAYVLFFFSGCAGLMYESVWPRYLKLIVGHGTYAQVLVLSIFLGGMAVGSFLVGRFISRIRRPLLLYAWVELSVGVVGLFFHPLYLFAADFSYSTLFPAASGPLSLSVLKFLITAAMILPQSILLGATFPLISTFVMRARGSGSEGNTLALLYFSNSFGAAVGVLLAGFVFLSLTGLPGTSMSAGFINILVGLAAWRLHSGFNPGEEGKQSETVAPAAARDVFRSKRRVLMLVCFGTAVASLVYEVGWIRMLSLILGSSTHVFELMLSAFVLGMATGGFAVRKRVDLFTRPERALGFIQLLMGLFAIGTIPLFLSGFGFEAWLHGVLSHDSNGYSLYTVVRYLFCFLVMLPPTFMAGAVFPVIVKFSLANGGREGDVGLLYGCNTVGSIVGAALGLLLMPLLGLKFLLLSAGLLDCALGLLVFALFIPIGRGLGRSPLLPATLAVVLVFALVGYATPYKPGLLSSGVYRTHSLPDLERQKVLFNSDGWTSTVYVCDTGSSLVIKNNGKPDASARKKWLAAAASGDSSHSLGLDTEEITMAMAGLVSLAHNPSAARIATVGMGSGITSHFLLASPNAEVVETIEIEPAVIKGAGEFRAVNRRLFDDPRSKIVVEDAKAHFATQKGRYDLIVSEPSNPWVSGISNLFTTEFYRRVEEHLDSGGVFAQWINLYENDDRLVLSVMAALRNVFGAFKVYNLGNGDILMVAQKGGAKAAPDWRTVLAWPSVRSDLSPFQPISEADMAGLFFFESGDMADLLDDAVANSDFFPILDLGSEKPRYMKTSSSFLGFYNSPVSDLFSLMSGRAFPLGAEDGSALELSPRNFARRFASAVRAAADSAASGNGHSAKSAAAGVGRRYAAYREELKAGMVPADWVKWLEETIRFYSVLHSASSGEVDEDFFRAVEAYLAKTGAPIEFRDMLALLKATSLMDFRRAALAADSLYAARDKLKAYGWDFGWIGEAGAVAYLRVGNRARVEPILDAFPTDSLLRASIILSSVVK